MWCGVLGTRKFHVLLVTEFEKCSGLRKSPGAEVDTTDSFIVEDQYADTVPGTVIC